MQDYIIPTGYSELTLDQIMSLKQEHHKGGDLVNILKPFQDKSLAIIFGQRRDGTSYVHSVYFSLKDADKAKNELHRGNGEGIYEEDYFFAISIPIQLLNQGMHSDTGKPLDAVDVFLVYGYLEEALNMYSN